LGDVYDEIFGQTAFSVKGGEGYAVEASNAFIGAKPHCTVSVLKDGVDVAAGQSIRRAV
jgi:hypothetical protein